jgi:beta-N-acetylhexosaminidase
MLSLEEKIGQMMMVGFHGLEAPEYILEWLEQGRIGGVYFFGRNIGSPEQVGRLTEACHNAAPRPIFIGIDQEGGSIAQLREGFTESPGAMALSAIDSEELTKQVAKMLAIEMRALGINWTFAPVADITHDIGNPTVGTRSFGINKERVSQLVAAGVRGFQDGMVAACAKHYPGLGNSPVDTHKALAVVNSTADILRENDLAPFRAAIKSGVATIMTTHTKYPAFDTEYPATLSPIIVQKMLREELNYDGIVCTDCMEMKAITNHYAPGEAAVLAVQAGVDLILVSHTRAHQEASLAGLVEAAKSGRLSEERIDAALARIQAAKSRFAITKPPSIEIIRHPDHLELAERVARSSTVLLRGDSDVFPINSEDHKVAVVEFASHRDPAIIAQEGETRLVKILQRRATQIEIVSLNPTNITDDAVARAFELARDVDVLVLATRSVHLHSAQLKLAHELVEQSKRAILLCLLNPYDVNVLPDVETMLCTCGDSTPSLQAAVDALFGDFIPFAKLPVPVNLETT